MCICRRIDAGSLIGISDGEDSGVTKVAIPVVATT
jgi:hypothetical protein